MHLRVLTLLAVWFFLGMSALGQVDAEEGTVAIETTLPRLSDQLKFDGVVDDLAWREIQPVPLVKYGPTYGDELTERTELRIAHDDDYVYFSAVCYDRHPITQTTLRRDDWSPRDDQISITLDSFNDSESGLVFVLYSTGARIDASIANDGRTGSDVSVDWNTFWDAKVTNDDEGWYAEVRIPASSLRFKPRPDGSATMGVLAYRFIARNQELQIFPDVPPNWGFWSFVKPSKGQRLDMDGLKPSRPFYITPYIAGGLGQEFDLNEAETAYIRSDDPTYDVGFDVKYGITSNLTLDLSVNTDFAQVEADNQQVNLTRFSLFFPEKRRFFLERIGNFDFNFGGLDRVFYSRRIGIVDGEQVPLLAGARVVGRAGPWDIGVLSMQSGRAFDVRSANSGVVRLKRTVFNSNSFFGGIMTSSVDEDGFYSLTYGIDGTFNIGGDDYLLVSGAQTAGSNTGKVSDNILDRSRLRFFYNRNRSQGFGFGLGVNRSGSDYDPALGFQLRDDFTELAANGSFGWRPGSESPLASGNFSTQNSYFFSNERNTLETIQHTGMLNLSSKSSHDFGIGVVYNYENLNELFEFSDDADVPAGEYSYTSVGLSYGQPPGRKFRTAYALEAGSFFDGRILSFSFNPSWTISPNIGLQVNYQYNDVEFGTREQSFVSHLIRGQADMTLNTRISLSALAQYNSAGESVSINARFRFNPREGNDFFLVFNQGLNTNRLGESVLKPITSSRAVIAKYTYTFRR